MAEYLGHYDMDTGEGAHVIQVGAFIAPSVSEQARFIVVSFPNVNGNADCDGSSSLNMFFRRVTILVPEKRAS
jgi:hypothetical protein